MTDLENGGARWASKDKRLHKAVVKLAHDKPELRKDLLPLVREAGAIDKTPPRVRLSDLTRTEKILIKEAKPSGPNGLYEIGWPKNYVRQIHDHLAGEGFIWALREDEWLLTDKGVAAKAKLTRQSYEDLMTERWAYLERF